MLRQMLGQILAVDVAANPQDKPASPAYGSATDKLGEATLFARTAFRDYQKATFSFEHALRDDPTNITGNDWDVQYGNAGNHFHVAMVSDDRSRMIDLGATTWEELDMDKLEKRPPYPRPRREFVPAVTGHIYLVHTVDRNTDLYALFRVEKITQKGTCDITWKRIKPPGAEQ